jgi:bifunctional DNA-binding transcriptional regulator/antitoxin component of YhaV-PrlF toxin-antitoxin module
MTMLFRTVRQGSEKARIWQICDEWLERTGTLPTARDVIAAYVAEGGNANTGATQYSVWKKTYREHSKIHDGDDAAETSCNVGFSTITIDAEGHVILPREMRRAMKLDADGRATACVVDGELRVVSPRVALQRLQSRVQPLHRGRDLVSEELIAERRAEAAGE